MTVAEILSNIIDWIRTGIPFNVKSSNVRALLTWMTKRMDVQEPGRLKILKKSGNSSIEMEIGDRVTGVVEDTFIFNAIYLGGNISLLASYFIITNTGGTNPRENTYADINSVGELLDDQGNQTAGFLQEVTDASDDPDVDSGRAIYLYIGTTDGDLEDYIRLTASEVETIINAPSYRTFQVKDITETLPTSTAINQVILEKDGSNNITSILFDVNFSGYLLKFKTRYDLGLPMYLHLWNKTQLKSLLAPITGFVIVDTDYIQVNFSTWNTTADVALGDYLDVYIDVDSAGSASLFLGTYLTEAALISAHPTASPGSRANVNIVGSIDKVKEYLWDSEDEEWVFSGTISSGTGIPTELEAFTSIIKTDKQYFSVGANALTQTDVISFTAVLTGAIINGGGIKHITSNGDAWLFSGDFGEIGTGLTLVDNQIIPDADVKYALIFYYNGTKIDVSIIELQTVNFIPQLNAPVLLTVVEGSGSGELDITFTDTNTSPNEVNTAVYVKQSGDPTYVINSYAPQDATTHTITGLLDNTTYDIYLRGKGEVGVSNDSSASNVESGTTADVITPLLIDDLSTVDGANWATAGTLNSIITLTGGQWNITEPITGSGSYTMGSKDRVIRFNTTTYPLQVWNIVIERPDRTTPPLFQFQLRRNADAFRYINLETDSAGSNKLRIKTKHSTAAETSTLTTELFDGRFKIVIDATLLTTKVYKWVASAWSLLTTQTFGDMVDLIATISLNETFGAYTENDVTIMRDLVITDVDYATETYAG